ncbi:MAG: transglutaminase family protein [Candidatus Dojkabacteria bacterium]|nr:transglutaminase family protein [Candidatus Dojkabacteria bacterium]
MKNKILTIILLLPFLIPTNIVHASSYDFKIDTDTKIYYNTGDTYVTVKNRYTREVENSSYYYPAKGEKVFHIPDISSDTDEEITTERKYKRDSITVKDLRGNNVKYTIEEQEIPNGIYVNIPNYKTTTSSSPYIIEFTYKTHDYVDKINSFVTIQGLALPEDIVFQQEEKSTKTLTQFNYYLSIIVDSKISPLAKIYPSKFTTSTKDGKTTYSFSQTDRIETSPYLEFGTKQTYKFELTYNTPKTDSIVPQSYSNIFKALSTNIYEISLPREYGETEQSILFSNVSPTPTNLFKDTEGNIIATFEVPANEEGKILVEGYITVSQDEYSTNNSTYDMDFAQYQEKISGTEYIQKYLSATKYWEVKDPYIVQEAQRLAKDQTTIAGIIEADYQFVNERLEYDESKANSSNERIGAKAALYGGASVCMEYADSMIALLRAQGIPSRAALGYANLSENQEEEQVRHQWVQVWIPEYGWLTVDPTLESRNMKIGKSIDRVLWETFNGDSLSNIRVFSADNINSLTAEGYSIKIYGVDALPDENLMGYTDIIPEKGYESIDDIPTTNTYSFGNWLNTFLKTTTLGKSLIITGPIILTIIILTVIILSIVILIRVIKKKRGLKQTHTSSPNQ